VVFPHHENEIAQSESFTGKKPFVKYWVHNGLLQMGEEKMSRSVGNLIKIREALESYSSDAIHVFVLGSYYRGPLTYTEEALEAAERGADRLRQAVSRDDTGGKGEALDATPYYEEFIRVMDDDFNTSEALAVLFDLAREINHAGDAGISIGKAQSTLLSLAREVLGFRLPKTQKIFAKPITVKATVVRATIEHRTTTEDKDISHKVKSLVTRLIEERANCREEKNWQRADAIRNKLNELGVIQEDNKSGISAAFKEIPSEESLEKLINELGIEL